MAQRFTCLVERQWDGLVDLWERERERGCRKEEGNQGQADIPKEEEHKVRRNNLNAMGKGNTSKCMNLLLSPGLADLDDPAVL